MYTDEVIEMAKFTISSRFFRGLTVIYFLKPFGYATNDKIIDVMKMVLYNIMCVW